MLPGDILSGASPRVYNPVGTAQVALCQLYDHAWLPTCPFWPGNHGPGEPWTQGTMEPSAVAVPGSAVAAGTTLFWCIL